MNYIITETEKEEFESFLKMKKDCASQIVMWNTHGSPHVLRFYSKDETIELLKKEVELARELCAISENEIRKLENVLLNKKKSTWF